MTTSKLATSRDGEARPEDGRGVVPPNPLRLIRLRVRLALLAMAILPIALSMALIRVVLVPQQGGEALWILALMVALTMLAAALTVRITGQVLRPAEELERSRTDMRRMYEIARADSLRDALTSLGNHRAFQEELDRQIELYQRHQVPVALVLLDLDDLKLVNDSEGHAAGDEILREMGRLVSEASRYADRAFRVGGDEFVILMPHTTAEGAMQVAQRLQHGAAQARANGRPISFSGGISACPELATTRTQLYAQADAALYWCKRHGRASVDIFNSVRDRAANHEVTDELSVTIAHVVSEHLLRAAYQPIVDLGSGQVVGFEGLTRPMPESGFADPGSMFTAAETVGRTVELDLSCLNSVVSGAREMPAHQLLAINISPRTLEAPHFSADALLAILARHGIAPQRVVVELTERERVEDMARIQSNLIALQRAGLRIAADDVGAGNAGLRLLSQIRFDIVKIDLSLVQDGVERDSSRAVLRSLRDLAGRWGASAIAEGVETVGHLRMVREMGVMAGQGYLLGPPMPSPILAQVDLAEIESDSLVLRRRPNTAEIALPAPTTG